MAPRTPPPSASRARPPRATLRPLLLAGALGLLLRAFPAPAAAQTIVGRDDLETLRRRPGEVLGAWVSLHPHGDPLPVLLCARPAGDTLEARLQLPPEAEGRLAPAIRRAPLAPFREFTASGRLFYEQGLCREGLIAAPGGPAVGFRYVPHRVAGRDNPAFLGDLGYLRLTASRAALAGRPDRLLSVAFAAPLHPPRHPAATLHPRLPDRFGVPHRLAPGGWSPPGEALLLPPVHKLSRNKHLARPEAKRDADLDDLVALLAPGAELLSQRERVRRGLAPDTLRLNRARLDETDIGTGQNAYVFLTLGPGINYFDAPWRSSRVTMPGPRLILDPAVTALADLQVYPTYSIAPPERGEGRQRAINRFQTAGRGAGAGGGGRGYVPMPPSRRRKVIRLIAEGLCRRGLLNDDPALDGSFALAGETFRGALVNNELRLPDGLRPDCWVIGILVPPGTARILRRRLRTLPPRAGGGPGRAASDALATPVLEAPDATDAGFRMAYLEFVLRRSRPALCALAGRLRDGDAVRPGYRLILAAIDRIIAREGPDFLRPTRRGRNSDARRGAAR